MIRVDRNSVPEPKQFASVARQAQRRLAKLMHAGVKRPTQKRLPLEGALLGSKPLRTALRKLFRERCAFCESPASVTSVDVVAHLRPPERAAGLSGKVDALHYWWLAYDWRNLYLSCATCARAKGTRFPVKGRRAGYRPGKEGFGDLASERSLLLDPCADEPETELQFLDDGTVRSDTDRGRITIDVFGLNRMSLVEARRRHCESVDAAIRTVLSASGAPRSWSEASFRETVVEQLSPEGGFQALTRQLATRALASAKRSAGTAEVSAARTQRPAKRPFHGAVWLRRIEIENFKALRHLELQFPSSETSPAASAPAASAIQPPDATPTSEPWLMLLGENGVGKSSLLKAVALALMSTPQRHALHTDPREWVSRGAKTGIIRLEFTVDAQPLELHFSSRSGVVVRKGDHPGLSVLGYGSTRVLPPRVRERPKPRRVHLQNLFDSRAPLRDAERWLANTRAVRSNDFNLLASSLRSLLSLDEGDRIARRRDNLLASVGGSRGPIRSLSDGYQSVLALALDMMLNLSHATFDMDGVEGVVLLDEIEVHLHPRWKIAIVGALRRLFPRVRFITTTHDPLCVHGLRQGELHILSRHGNPSQVVVEQFDVPPGYRADQILTGAWFGVPSTRDPETVAFMQEHSSLLQVLSRTPAQDLRFSELDRLLRRRLDEYVGTEEQLVALQAAARLKQARIGRGTVLTQVQDVDLLHQTIANALGVNSALPMA